MIKDKLLYLTITISHYIHLTEEGKKGIERDQNLWSCNDWEEYSPEDQHFLVSYPGHVFGGTTWPGYKAKHFFKAYFQTKKQPTVADNGHN